MFNIDIFGQKYIKKTESTNYQTVITNYDYYTNLINILKTDIQSISNSLNSISTNYNRDSVNVSTLSTSISQFTTINTSLCTYQDYLIQNSLNTMSKISQSTTNVLSARINSLSSQYTRNTYLYANSIKTDTSTSNKVTFENYIREMAYRNGIYVPGITDNVAMNYYYLLSEDLNQHFLFQFIGETGVFYNGRINNPFGNYMVLHENMMSRTYHSVTDKYNLDRLGIQLAANKTVYSFFGGGDNVTIRTLDLYVSSYSSISKLSLTHSRNPFIISSMNVINQFHNQTDYSYYYTSISDYKNWFIYLSWYKLSLINFFTFYDSILRARTLHGEHCVINLNLSHYSTCNNSTQLINTIITPHFDLEYSGNLDFKNDVLKNSVNINSAFVGLHFGDSLTNAEGTSRCWLANTPDNFKTKTIVIAPRVGDFSVGSQGGMAIISNVTAKRMVIVYPANYHSMHSIMSQIIFRTCSFSEMFVGVESKVVNGNLWTQALNYSKWMSKCTIDSLYWCNETSLICPNATVTPNPNTFRNTYMITSFS